MTLASATARVVEIEALMQAQRERDLAAAIDALTTEQRMVLSILLYRLHDGPVIEPVVGWPEFLRFLRAGLPADLLPRPLRPDLERAHAHARRVIAGEQTPELSAELGGWAEWLLDDDAAAGSWME